VAVCPTNAPTAREDATDVVFKTELSKWSAVCAEIKRMHKTGRPVLVGTTSVERSEFLAGLLNKEGIPFQLLNAKPEFVEKESEIIAQSGRSGQVRSPFRGPSFVGDHLRKGPNLSGRKGRK
jgi:preprotein translocase subunit SecA